MSIETAYEALTTDAQMWRETSATLAGAAGATTGLTLTDTHLSWASQESGLNTTYAELRDKAERLLRDGAIQTERIADTLEEVRRTYEGADDGARRDLQGVWEPRG